MLLFLFIVFSIVEKFYFRNQWVEKKKGVGQCSVLVFLRQTRKVNHLYLSLMCALFVSFAYLCINGLKKKNPNQSKN